MFVRWIQLGIFHTFCRVHSSQDDGDQEPWSFGETALNHFREAVELRYRMLPYHYTAFYRYTQTGVPILKPLSFYDQTDSKTLYRDNEFICGDHILTCSINEPDQASVSVYLPQGKWYNYWNHKICVGRNFIHFPLTLDTFPLFVKEGAIIPLYPVQQYVDEEDFQVITLDVFYKKGTETSYLYEDSHDGYGYVSGDFRESEFTLIGSHESLVIRQQLIGNHMPKYAHFKLNLIGLPFQATRAEVDGEAIDLTEMRVPISFSEIRITGKPINT
jgi:alpha-glucosidase